MPTLRMAYRNFPGKTREWLEEKLNAILEEEAGGKSETGGTLGEVGFSQIMIEAPHSVKGKLLRDLNVLAPADYPIGDISIPNRTFATFSGAI